MKKYSTEYYRDRFQILYKRLLEKDGFENEIRKERKSIGIPEEGFQSSLELAQYFMDRLSKKEKEITTTLAFVEQYKKTDVFRDDKETWKKIQQDFNKKFKENFVPMLVLIPFQMHIEGHNDFFTKDPLITYGKKNKNLFSPVKKIFEKFMGLDLLDQHIIAHFVEKHLFLGNNGVNNYINEKVACPHCRSIGVSHFSPDGTHMKGRDMGPFSGKYLFNDGTVRLLSSYFDSVFVIIRPYATKEQVLQYIDDSWDDLKEHIVEKNTFYKQYDIHPFKIKKSDTERNKLIYELYKLSKKDLLKKYKGERDLSIAGIYKEIIISEILKESGVEMSADAVKKTATRFAQSKRKMKPKDIRDI